MPITLALAGDAMLGRGVAERLRHVDPEQLVSGEVRAAAAEADLFVLNLECCVSERGAPWPDPRKPFHFRAPPAAVETLAGLGVDCVTLANNHALDFGARALADTRTHLADAGIAAVGAGPDAPAARAPAVLDAGGFRLAVLGMTDHPDDFAADAERAGVAYAPLQHGVPDWALDAVRSVRNGTTAGSAGSAAGSADRARPADPAGPVDAVLVTPHWGPNMTSRPVAHVRSAARALVDVGATLVAGHSAHVVHGVQGRVLYDLGGFVDDYAVHPGLRNDLGLLFLVTLDAAGPSRVEAVPLALDYCHTRLARGEEYAGIRHRFAEACAELDTEVGERRGRLVVTLDTGS